MTTVNGTPQNTGLATGHDAPVQQRIEDFYDRWQIATAISRVIDAAPAEWSTRIGIFGRWGDGKTSVLNFLEIQQQQKKNIVVRYSPWGATTEEEIWKGISSSLIAGLKQAGIKVNFLYRLIYWLTLAKNNIATFIKKGGEVVEATGKAPGATLGTSVVSDLIQRHFKFTRELIEKITVELNDRKIVIFIDDLDRTDASLIPRLLLSLRELLDFSKFTFVLAFDKQIVRASIEKNNSAWVSAGEDFLSKVIDFPFDLPAPSQKQIKQLVLDQFAKQCPFVPVTFLEEVGNLFPSNPRKLKLIVRIIAATKEEVGRHEIEELNWVLILIFTMIRVESEGFASALLTKTISSHGMDWGRWMQDRAERERQNEIELDAVIAKFPELEHAQVRIKLLVNSWRTSLPIIAGQNVYYQAMFSVTPHSITWGEFKFFFRIWQVNKTSSDIDLFINRRVTIAQQTRALVEEEFLRSIIEYYAGLLESASHVGTGADHSSLMLEANDALDLLMLFVDPMQSLCSASKEDLFHQWKHLFGISIQWRHFNANLHEPEIRAKEVKALSSFLNRINDPLAIYEFLAPGSDYADYAGRQRDLRNEFTNVFRLLVQPTVIQIIYNDIRLPGKLQELKGLRENLAAQYLLTSPASPIFLAENKPTFIQALTARFGTEKTRDDALTYLDFLLSGMAHNNRYCTAEQCRIFIHNHQDLIILLWRLSISERSQFRMLQSLRERRETIIEAGIPAESIDEPDWLQEI